MSWGHLSTWSCGIKRAHPAPPACRTHGWASMEMGMGQWVVSGEGLRIGEWEPCLSVGSAVVPQSGLWTLLEGPLPITWPKGLADNVPWTSLTW